MKKLFILFIFTLLFASCKKSEIKKQAPLGVNLSSCIIGKWSDSSLPLNLKISSTFGLQPTTPDINNLNPIEKMAKVWNDAVPSKELIRLPMAVTSNPGFDSTTSFNDGEMGIYKSDLWFSNVSRNALAIAQFYGTVTASPGLGTYLLYRHADIIVNYRDFGSEFTMTNAPTFDFDVPTVILHEMGHLLGLCHEVNQPSIMAPYYLTTQHNIQQSDKTIINNLYGPSASAYSVKKNNNTNALSLPVGTEVSGMIELRDDGKCLHYLNGVKIFEHSEDIEKFKKKK